MYCVSVGADCKILIIAVEWKSLDFNTKLEIIHRCEDGSSSKNETRRQHGLNSLPLFTTLKNKEKIWYILNTSKITLFLSFMNTHW
jgi:hypothetical protein